jgi:hypothetical protein
MALSKTQADTINALLYIESDIPNTVTFGGNTYPAVVSTSMQEKVLGIGGYVIDKTANITLRLFNSDGSSVFTTLTLPVPQQLLNYSSQQYRILQIRTAPQGTHIRVVAVCDNRGL